MKNCLLVVPLVTVMIYGHVVSFLFSFEMEISTSFYQRY
jgi:hypothetical protein